MKNLFGCFLFFSLSLSAQEQFSFEKSAWLAGSWDGSTDKKEVVEMWMKPAGQMMMGMSRTVKGGKLAEFEFMRIHQEANGDVFYTAKPSGQPEDSFKLIRWSADEMVFENPKHDFPQRILYRLQKDGSLMARIEGTYNGKESGRDFPMKRIKE